MAFHVALLSFKILFFIWDSSDFLPPILLLFLFTFLSCSFHFTFMPLNFASVCITHNGLRRLICSNCLVRWLARGAFHMLLSCLLSSCYRFGGLCRLPSSFMNMYRLLTLWWFNIATENHNVQFGKLTMSMAIFNSKLSVYERVYTSIYMHIPLNRFKSTSNMDNQRVYFFLPLSFSGPVMHW